jgi:hypothetical protein
MTLPGIGGSGKRGALQIRAILRAASTTAVRERPPPTVGAHDQVEPRPRTAGGRGSAICRSRAARGRSRSLAPRPGVLGHLTRAHGRLVSCRVQGGKEQPFRWDRWVGGPSGVRHSRSARIRGAAGVARGRGGRGATRGPEFEEARIAAEEERPERPRSGGDGGDGEGGHRRTDEGHVVAGRERRDGASRHSSSPSRARTPATGDGLRRAHCRGDPESMSGPRGFGSNFRKMPSTHEVHFSRVL